MKVRVNSMSQTDRLHQLFSHVYSLKSIQARIEKRDRMLASMESDHDMAAIAITPKTVESVSESSACFDEQIKIMQKISPPLASELYPMLDGYDRAQKVLEDKLIKSFNARAKGLPPTNTIEDLVEHIAEISGHCCELLLYTAQAYNCLMDVIYFLGHADEMKEYEAAMEKGPKKDAKPRPHPKRRMPEIDWMHHLITVIQELRAIESEMSEHDDRLSKTWPDPDSDPHTIERQAATFMGRGNTFLRKKVDAVQKISPVLASEFYPILDNHEEAQKALKGKLAELSRINAGKQATVDSFAGIEGYVYKVAAYHDELTIAVKIAYDCYVGAVNFLGHGSELNPEKGVVGQV